MKWASLNKHDENLSGSLLEIVIYGGHILIKGLKILWVSDNSSPDTAVFFKVFNFKMKIFQILGHLCIVGDHEFENFSF